MLTNNFDSILPASFYILNALVRQLPALSDSLASGDYIHSLQTIEKPDFANYLA
jgi:hypothetical protein